MSFKGATHLSPLSSRLFVYNLGLLLQYCVVAPYLLSEAAASYAVPLFTASYVYTLLVAFHSNNSVQPFNSPCLRTVRSPLQLTTGVHTDNLQILSCNHCEAIDYGYLALPTMPLNKPTMAAVWSFPTMSRGDFSIAMKSHGTFTIYALHQTTRTVSFAEICGFTCKNIMR